MERLSITITDTTKEQIEYIRNWLLDMPFQDIKLSTSEAIRISINHFYHWIKESNKMDNTK